jgi:hypothetical protein
MQWGKASKLVMVAVLNQVKSSGKQFKERIKGLHKGKGLCRGKSWDNVQERKRNSEKGRGQSRLGDHTLCPDLPRLLDQYLWAH